MKEQKKTGIYADRICPEKAVGFLQRFLEDCKSVGVEFSDNLTLLLMRQCVEAVDRSRSNARPLQSKFESRGEETLFHRIFCTSEESLCPSCRSGETRIPTTHQFEDSSDDFFERVTKNIKY